MATKLVNRRKITATIDMKLSMCLDELNAETRINKSRLLDEAIEDLLKKYETKKDLYLK